MVRNRESQINSRVKVLVTVYNRLCQTICGELSVQRGALIDRSITHLSRLAV